MAESITIQQRLHAMAAESEREREAESLTTSADPATVPVIPPVNAWRYRCPDCEMLRPWPGRCVACAMYRQTFPALYRRRAQQEVHCGH